MIVIRMRYDLYGCATVSRHVVHNHAFSIEYQHTQQVVVEPRYTHICIRTHKDA